jgi:hypothetical protein
MTWFYNEEPITDITQIPDKTLGFVYEIVSLIDGKRYFGKKILYFTKTKMVKGKKKRTKVESDWKDYYGSSEDLMKDVELHGGAKFHRKILHFCANKGMMSYLELREQMDHRVLEHPDKFYNRQVHARVHASHVKVATT